MATGAIIARIITQYSAKGSKQAQKDITKLGKDFDKFAKKSALAFAAASAAVGAFAFKVGTDAVRAAMEDQKSQALLASTLRNTVGATDAAIASTEDYITLLQKEVSVSDDELRPALATLARATGDVASAQSLLGTALNISAGTGKDLASVSLALSKAVNGNLGALTRLGIPLDANTIKSKDFNKALGVLNETFKDQANVRAKTLEFRLKGLNIAYGEVLETLGYALLPVIERFADVVSTQVLPKLEAWIAANKDDLAAGLEKILGQIPKLITQVFNLFDYIQRNLGTIKVLAALLVSTFAATKVYAGVVALTGAINILTAAFGKQAVAATAAGTATAFATGGASALAAAAAIATFTTAALVAYKQLNKNNDAIDAQNTKIRALTPGWGNVYGAPGAKNADKVVVATGKILGNTTKLTAEQKKQIATQEALNKLKAMGVVPTSETDPIQLEAVRLNLLKEQNLAQKAMYDQLLANYEATNRMNIAAQRYADILMVISDSKISQEEVNLLASKWNLTNYEVVKYIASVTGNVNLGAGWDAAGLAAADGWKKALEELNKYLEAVGKENFIAKQNVPKAIDYNAIFAPNRQQLAAATQTILTLQQKVAATNKIPDTPTANTFGQSMTTLPDYLAYRAGERASINVTVNNAGNAIVANDLTETIRNGILAGQTSGRSINARVLDL
ncbi:MAG: hypothetical protein KGR70_13465 [Cyanobacteria bacterium REEB494]|nr:hypothetical protein [Cyanobacteria bacterium REEB494]